MKIVSWTTNIERYTRTNYNFTSEIQMTKSVLILGLFNDLSTAQVM
jgi:hypothetical protein